MGVTTFLVGLGHGGFVLLQYHSFGETFPLVSVFVNDTASGGALRSRVSSTPATPKKAAARNAAPRLRGSCTSSRITTSSGSAAAWSLLSADADNWATKPGVSTCPSSYVRVP